MDRVAAGVEDNCVRGGVGDRSWRTPQVEILADEESELEGQPE